jgi:hypothetical protein
MEIATRRDNVHLTDHGHLPALTKPEQRTLQAAKPVGGHALTLTLVALIRDHVLAAERIHGDDTRVPVLTKGKTITGRLWTYVRDDRPFRRNGAAGFNILLLA